ncbi:MAG TPA: hypothetical protein VKS20_00420 [Candidatus Acidoferrales bacterium]|nr:hypothetical protein [Candidatus Acidoferrales bacterium]
MISAFMISGGFSRVGKLVLLCFVALMLSAPTFAFCTEPQPTVACEFLDSDAVFIGTVISTRNTPAQGDEFDEGWTYEISVQKMYRGPHGKTINVFTENNSARFPLETGREYVLFAAKIGGRFEIFGCGNSALLSEAGNTIEELGKVKVPEDAEIEGRIGIPNTETQVKDAHIVIQGEGKTYTVMSDRHGWFHLHVPPGKYSADVQPMARWNISPFDLSTDNPKDFVATKGHCSGLQFWADPK